jgi:hypothetical protein
MQQPSPRPSTDPLDVDLTATQRRFRLAREQSASQSSTERIRSIAIMRWWQTELQRGEGASNL